MTEVSAPIPTALPTVVSSPSAPATLNELIQLQYVRGKTFAAWSNLFRMMLKGDLTAADYDGLVSRIVLPQIQSVNNVFRATSESSSSSSSSASSPTQRFTGQWAANIQSIERRRYNDIVAYQQAVVDHLASAINPHDNLSTPSGSKQDGSSEHHHHHHCCRGEHRAHTTACLFYDGNGTRAASVVSAMELERTEAPKKPIGSSTTLEEGKADSTKEGGDHGTSSLVLTGASERAQLVAKQKAFISNLMSGLPSSATTSNGGGAGAVHPLPSQFLSFGSQKAIPTCFADLALEYIVLMEWVSPVSAVGEADAGENTHFSVSGSPWASGTSTKKAAVMEDSDEEPEYERESNGVKGGARGDVNGGHASPNDDDDDDDDEELIIRKLASAKCTAFEAKIRSLSRDIAEAEASLQEALDEALEELNG